MQKAGKWSAAGLSKIQTWRRPQICWKPPRLQHHFYHGLGFYMIYDPSNHFFCLVHYYLSTVYNKEAGYNMPLYVQIVVFSKYWPLFNVYIHIVLLYTAANWQMSSWEDFFGTPDKNSHVRNYANKYTVKIYAMSSFLFLSELSVYPWGFLMYQYGAHKKCPRQPV